MSATRVDKTTEAPGQGRQKKWIGNATFADVTVIWARDEAENQVSGK